LRTGVRGVDRTAICPGGCIPNAECVRPSLCRCLDGFTGPKCRWTRHSDDDWRQNEVMSRRAGGPSVRPGESSLQRCRGCLNGGRCVRDRCKCLPGFTGPRCRTGLYHISLHPHSSVFSSVTCDIRMPVRPPVCPSVCNVGGL